MTIEDIERSEGGVEAFIAGIQKELHEKTYRARPVRRKYYGEYQKLGLLALTRRRYR